MAGEVGHVVYGNRVAKYLGIDASTGDFWSGTLFPDIGHVGAVRRTATHPKDVTINNLKSDDLFVTGIRVHAWIDAAREAYLKEQNMKERLPWHMFVPQALKLLEDEWLYDDFNDWPLIGRSLRKDYETARDYVHDIEIIKHWYEVLHAYLKVKPNKESRLELAKAIGLTESSARELNSVVEDLRVEGTAHRLFEGWSVRLGELLN